MLIKIEDIAAKGIINFYPPVPVLSANNAVLADKNSPHPLLKAIMEIDGVERCLATDTLLSVKIKADVNADDIKSLTAAEIDDYLSEEPTALTLENNQADTLRLVEALADALIRPTLNRDKGDIVIHSFIDGVLEIQFTGHCAGCPYAQNTLQNVIARNLQRYLPQLKTITLRE